MAGRLLAQGGAVCALAALVGAMPSANQNGRPDFALRNANADFELSGRFTIPYATPEVFDFLIGPNWKQVLVKQQDIGFNDQNTKTSFGDITITDITEKANGNAAVIWESAFHFKNIYVEHNLKTRVQQTLKTLEKARPVPSNGTIGTWSKNEAHARLIYRIPAKKELWFCIENMGQVNGLFVMKELAEGQVATDISPWINDNVENAKLKEDSENAIAAKLKEIKLLLTQDVETWSSHASQSNLSQTGPERASVQDRLYLARGTITVIDALLEGKKPLPMIPWPSQGNVTVVSNK